MYALTFSFAIFVLCENLSISNGEAFIAINKSGLIDLFNFIRPDDININVAVKNSDDKAIFYYQKKLSQLTTINKEIANQRMQGHIKQMEIKSNKLTTIINNTKYKNRKIDFLNIDLEGADFEALQSLDFNIYRPKLICVEIYDEDIEESNINLFLKDLEYTRKSQIKYKL